MAISLALVSSSCMLTTSPPPNPQRVNSFSKSPKIATKKALFPTSSPCKPLSKPFIISNSFSSKNGVDDDSSPSLSSSSGSSLLQQLNNLELKVQKIKNSSSGATTNNNDNNASSEASLLEGVLQELYSLGLKILELDPTRTSSPASNLTEETRTKDNLLVVDPKPNLGDNSKKIDQLIADLAKLYYGTIETPYYLKGNFGPIREETPPTDLVIDGDIPDSINGMMLRVGPNAQYDPEANYRWLDGDGMVHGIRFKDGKATYVSRYVKTSRFLQEGVFGKATMFKYGDVEGYYGLFAAFAQSLRTKLQVLDMSFGYTTSNIGLVYHNGMVMVLEDFGKPHVIRVKDDGDLETIGINDYNGKLKHNVTPHPKKDPETGEMFLFGSSQSSPYATYRVVSSDGSMGDPVPITVTGPTYMHDFGLTKNYAIFMDNPYCFGIENTLSNEEWIFSFDDTKKSRFGILPRYATNEDNIKWFEFEKPFFVFHVANAWEEDEGKIVLICCKMEAAINPKTNKASLAPVTAWTGKYNEDYTLSLPKLFKMTFNMSTGEATQEKLANSLIDNPKINLNYVGRKLRYVYTNEMNNYSKLPAIIKFDLESKTAISALKLRLERNKYISEPVFVPRESSGGAAPVEEDDGHLITFVHDEDSRHSYVYVIDAQTMKVVSTIKLPRRVPYGFHSIYVTEKQIAAQASGN